MVVHTFLWVVAGHCLRAGIIESHNFFVLRCILVKFHIRTRLIGSFPSTYRSWSCAEEKLHFTPVHTSSHNIAEKTFTNTIQQLLESMFQFWWCAKEKLHLTPVHTLRQLKCDEGLFPPLPISLAMIPVLCTGRPYFLFTLIRLFQSLCLALLSNATAVSGSSHLFVGGRRPLSSCRNYRKP